MTNEHSTVGQEGVVPGDTNPNEEGSAAPQGQHAWSLKDVTDGIAEALQGCDGEYVAGIYNKICSDKIKYIGDSLYEQLPFDGGN